MALSCFVGQGFRASHGGMVGHFQAVGHVAGETYVEDGRLDAVVLHDIYYLRDERPRLPSKGTAGLKDDAQVRIALVQSLEQADEVLDVVVGTCD